MFSNFVKNFGFSKTCYSENLNFEKSSWIIPLLRKSAYFLPSDLMMFSVRILLESKQ